MASSGGHLLVSKTLRLLKFGVEKAGRVIRDKLPQAVQAEARTQPVYARIQEAPLNRLVSVRQQQTRSYSTRRVVDNAVRYFTSTSKTASRPLRSSYPQSHTRAAVSRITSRTPFASTLRPNLTGGTLSRSAGGYNTGAGRVNGARYFSHGPAAPAEIVQNVSQAVRAFWLSGQKARFDGVNPRTGDKRFRMVSATQDKTRRTLDISNSRSAGSFIDFKVSPTITAIGPLSNVPHSSSYSDSCEFEHTDATITNAAIISTLAVDFARALKDLAAIMNDLKHLATLGDLPLSLLNPTTLRVHFPGCDADTVEALCRELSIRRGIVGQDEDFDARHGAEVALMFPFAPSKTPSDYDERPAKRSKRDHVDWHGMMSPVRKPSFDMSEWSSQLDPFDRMEDVVGLMTEEGEIVQNPWRSSRSAFSSLHPTDDGEEDVALFFAPDHSRQPRSKRSRLSMNQAQDYEGLEGIYKFIEECDRAKR